MISGSAAACLGFRANSRIFERNKGRDGKFGIGFLRFSIAASGYRWNLRVVLSQIMISPLLQLILYQSNRCS